LRVCSVRGCGKPHEARGLCQMHYMRWKKYGDTEERPAWRPVREYYENVVIPYCGDECLIWPFGRNARGYGILRHDGRAQIVSRLVCIEENGPPPTPEHQAAHSCGRGGDGCVTKKHMVWKTPAENTDDKKQHGTYGQKLDEATVREIRSLKGVVGSWRAAKRFDISVTMAKRILNGQAWGHVE
jgi:hypothetical protein